MPSPELLSGLILVLLVAVAIELAEVGARLRTAPLRHRDRITPEQAGAGSVADRLGGVALAVALIWFFALPWVEKAQYQASALVLFLAMFVVGVALLGGLRLAAVRYPLAAAAPLAIVAGATAMT